MARAFFSPYPSCSRAFLSTYLVVLKQKSHHLKGGLFFIPIIKEPSTKQTGTNGLVRIINTHTPSHTRYIFYYKKQYSCTIRVLPISTCEPWTIGIYTCMVCGTKIDIFRKNDDHIPSKKRTRYPIPHIDQKATVIPSSKQAVHR